MPTCLVLCTAHDLCRPREHLEHARSPSRPSPSANQSSADEVSIRSHAGRSGRVAVKGRTTPAPAWCPCSSHRHVVCLKLKKSSAWTTSAVIRGTSCSAGDVSPAYSSPLVPPPAGPWAPEGSWCHQHPALGSAALLME
jgi:hypothetical protein